MIWAKKFFNKISQREKILLTMVLWIGVIIWATLIIARMADLKADFNKIKGTLAYQAIWLGNQQVIKSRLAEALVKLDPTKTYSKNQFIAKVDSLAQKSKANYSINNPTTKAGDIFNEHALMVQFKDATINQFINFDNDISKEAPYLEVNKVSINPNPRDPNLLSIQFNIIAIELKDLKNIEDQAEIKSKDK